MDKHMKSFYFAGDFNTEETEPCLSEFLTKCDSKSLVKQKTCFKNRENQRCINLFITSSLGSFQKITAVASGWSDFHKIIVKFPFKNLNLKKFFIEKILT